MKFITLLSTLISNAHQAAYPREFTITLWLSPIEIAESKHFILEL
jgi:hypothetical protein